MNGVNNKEPERETDVENLSDQLEIPGDEQIKQEGKSINSNVIDVEATVQEDGIKSATSKDKNRQLKQQTWEERAQSYEQVPPSNVKAWGPDGIINDGIDIRTYAAVQALEEITQARVVFEKKEVLVKVAEDLLIQLKR